MPYPVESSRQGLRYSLDIAVLLTQTDRVNSHAYKHTGFA